MMTVQKPGIDTRFPSPRRFLETWQAAVPAPIGRLDHLRRYAAEGRFSLEPSIGGLPERYFDGSTCQGELRRCANDFALQTITKALNGDRTWYHEWPRVIAYFQCAFDLEFRFHAWALRQYQKGARRQHVALIPFDDVVWTMANCLILGWKDLGFRVFDATVSGLKDQFFMGKKQGMRRAHYFCLRLLASYKDAHQSFEWPSFACDEPIYEMLLNSWYSIDEAALRAPILAACDRHTHEARSDTDTMFHDFRRYPQMYQPFEILLLLRLRQWRALALPTVEHPLLDTPLGQLGDEVPEYSDDLLRGVFARAKQELPKD